MVINQGFQGFFPTFGLNTERYGVSLCIQSECGKIWTRKTPHLDTFRAIENFITCVVSLILDIFFIISIKEIHIYKKDKNTSDIHGSKGKKRR